jgi:hypothetical protein
MATIWRSFRVSGKPKFVRRSRRYDRAPLAEAIPETSRMKVHSTNTEDFNSY